MVDFSQSLAARLVGLPTIVYVNIGQSNEKGNVTLTETIGGVSSLTAIPQAYYSQRNSGVQYPIGPATAATGGWLFKLYDDMYDHGYDTQIVNAAIVNMSLVTDACGIVNTWTAATAYRAKRAPLGGGKDRGFYGDILLASGKLFVCTTGVAAYAMNSGPPIPGASSPNREYDQILIVGAQVSGATIPAGFAAANVGDVITDNTVSWTCISATSTYQGASYTAGSVLTQARAGFDPYGILQAADDAAMAIKGARYRIVNICNGQADLNNTALYQSAMTNVIQRFAGGSGGTHNYYVQVGLTVFDPVDTSGSTTSYESLKTAMNAAYTAQLANFPDKLKLGADLYTLMGSTGPMASGGAYFNKDGATDNRHINAAGAIVAGGYVANALKAWLPKGARAAA